MKDPGPILTCLDVENQLLWPKAYHSVKNVSSQNHFTRINAKFATPQLFDIN